MNDLIGRDEQHRRLRDDADRLGGCLERVDLTTPVATCPGWDLRALGVHTAFIHRWATAAAATGAPPDAGAIAEPAPDADGAGLAAWIRAGADTLVDVLAGIPADAATWHPFPFEQRAWVWSRRQMIETAIHRWDAETAAVGASDLDGALSATGVAEYFELGLPRVLQRENVTPPASSLHVHCTDDDLPTGSGEWIVWNEGGDYRMSADHRRADAALRGRAADLLLVLMGRADRSTIDIVGDPDVAAAWLDLPGW